MIEVPGWAECPSPFAIGQDRRGARASRRKAGTGRAIEGEDVESRRHFDGSEATSCQKRIFRSAVRFEFSKWYPRSRQVPTARNFVRKVFTPDALLFSLFGHVNVFALYTDGTFRPQHLSAGSGPAAAYEHM